MQYKLSSTDFPRIAINTFLKVFDSSWAIAVLVEYSEIDNLFRKF